MGKLVRDRIPELISASGRTPVVERISGQRLERALKRKLLEEAGEILRARTDAHLKEEIADMFEVLAALIRSKSLEKREMALIRRGKRRKSGGFSEGFYLKGIKAHRPEY